MHVEAERHIPCPITTVWAALNDLDTLRASIPGCERLDRQEDGALTLVVRARVGPLQSTFHGRLRIADADPPHRCRLQGEGDAAAGFARGEADVQLEEDGAGGTRLTYHVEATVGGKLAQLGQRLVDSAAREFAEVFFTQLASQLAADVASDDGGDGAAPGDSTRPRGLSPLVWVPGLILVTLAMLLLFNQL
jgi:hypothetical protein